MRPWFSVGALALAARRANVAGAVRLTCAPDRLEIELVRVTGFAQGFAPGGLADPVGIRVPYTAVRGLVREGRMLYLTLDPAVVSPYTRFALARFAEDPDLVLARAFEARARVRWASFLLPPPLGVVAAAAVPDTLAGGVLGRASLGALAMLAAWAILRELLGWLTWGGPRSDRLRDRFEAELAEHLALAPPAGAVAPVYAVRLPARPSRRPPEPPQPVSAERPPSLDDEARSGVPTSLRLRPLLAALSAAVGVVLVVGFLRRHAVEEPPPPHRDVAVTGLAAAARAIRIDVPEPPPPERCVCKRADSPLWKDSLPVLSVLTFEGEDGASEPPEAKPDRAGFPQFAFELAVVNNSARRLRDVRVTLTFARRNKAGARVGAVDRGLFWGGVLSAGHAVKWNVSAPGSEHRLDTNVNGTLADKHLAPAPGDAFFALTSSRFRAVRLHAAVMLAYVRDPRAKEVARALAVQSTADATTIARVRRAAAPVFACEVRRDGELLEACLYNGASGPKGGLSLREVTAPPAAGEQAPAPRSVKIEGTLPAHDGLRVRLRAPADMAGELAVVDPNAVE